MRRANDSGVGDASEALRTLEWYYLEECSAAKVTQERRHRGPDQTCKLGRRKQVNRGATLTKHSLQSVAFRPLYSSE
jgi:hypothetical protein